MASQSESLGSQASEASQTSEASLDSSRSEDETPTTSDEEFIVSDSEMEEAEQEELEEDDIELLYESFIKSSGGKQTYQRGTRKTKQSSLGNIRGIERN